MMLTVSWLHPSTKGIYITEAVAQRYSVKKVFLEYHRKTPVPVSLFLINVQAVTCNFIIKKRHRQRFFPVNFAKFLRPHFLTEHLRWLLLRAPNFVSVSRLSTIQNTSNSLAKAHLRIPFLQNSSQWLLPVAAFKCQ